MLSVTKIFEFEAAHHLPDYDGPCRNVHGHSYRLEIEVTGSIQRQGSKMGMIFDFSDLKKIVKKEIVDCYDHRDLNNIFDVPTAENMVNEIVDRLRSRIEGLNRVRLYETSTSYCEWTRWDR